LAALLDEAGSERLMRSLAPAIVCPQTELGSIFHDGLDPRNPQSEHIVILKRTGGSLKNLN